jgi:Acetyltransferase (GNAT) family
LPPERSAPESIAPGASAWTLRRALARALDIQRREGLRALWFKALGETVYRRLLLLEASLESQSEPPPPPRLLEFAFLAPGEVGEYPFGEHGSETAAERLRRGDRCFCVRRDGHVVAVRWIAFEEASIEYLGCRLRLAPGVAYFYDSYTSPTARGSGIFSSTWFILARQLSSEGVHTVLAAVLPENRAALRAMEKLPYRVVGNVGYVRLGPRRRCFLRSRTHAATLVR